MLDRCYILVSELTTMLFISRFNNVNDASFHDHAIDHTVDHTPLCF